MAITPILDYCPSPARPEFEDENDDEDEYEKRTPNAKRGTPNALTPDEDARPDQKRHSNEARKINRALVSFSHPKWSNFTNAIDRIVACRGPTIASLASRPTRDPTTKVRTSWRAGLASRAGS